MADQEDSTDREASLNGESPAAERRRLLLDNEDSEPKAPSKKGVPTSVRLRSRVGSPSPERRPTESSEEEDRKRECGFVCIARTLLNLLPAFGDTDDTTERSEELLKFGALQIINLLAPVTLCMAVVLTFVLSVVLKGNAVASSASAGLNSIPFASEDSSNGGTQFLQAMANVAVIITVVVVMTIVLVCLFKFKCYKLIYGWLLLASILLLFVFASLYILNICRAHNLPLDWFSLSFCMWNFGVMGIIVIHWKGPLRLQQAYLIIICSLIASQLLQFLPDWTTWLLLFAISIWDLIAVLCPKGPLRILVETAQERNVELFPALIYSSTMLWTVGMADIPPKRTSPLAASDNDDAATKTSHPPALLVSAGSDEEGSSLQESLDQTAAAGGGQSSPQEVDPSSEPAADPSSEPTADPSSDSTADPSSEPTADPSSDSTADPSSDPSPGPAAGPVEGREPRPSRRPEGQEEEEEEEEERRGVRLGLGDFIFYSLLVGKAAFDSKGDWVIVSSCFVSILIGLCMTTILLGMLRRALPALPISVFFGLIFYFTSRYLLSPFSMVLALNQLSL